MKEIQNIFPNIKKADLLMKVNLLFLTNDNYKNIILTKSYCKHLLPDDEQDYIHSL